MFESKIMTFSRFSDGQYLTSIASMFLKGQFNLTYGYTKQKKQCEFKWTYYTFPKYKIKWTAYVYTKQQWNTLLKSYYLN